MEDLEVILFLGLCEGLVVLGFGVYRFRSRVIGFLLAIPGAAGIALVMARLRW